MSDTVTIGKCGQCAYRLDSGYCANDNLVEDYGEFTDKSRMLIYSYYESGNFWVGENFGCVHFEAKKE